MDGMKTAEEGGGSYGGDGLGSIGVDGRSAEGLQSSHRAPMAVCGRCGGQDDGERTQQGTTPDRAGASWRRPSVGRWVSQWPAAPSGWEWNGLQPGQGAAELGFPGPAPGEMQSEAARRAGESPGQGEEAPPEGLGGHYLLAQTEPGRPASQVVGHHLVPPARRRWRRSGPRGDG